jgi:hypothetical protein
VLGHEWGRKQGLFVILIGLGSDRRGHTQCHISKYGALRALVTSGESLCVFSDRKMYIAMYDDQDE